MNNEQAYDIWSAQYDTNENKTRDLEAEALRTILPSLPFDNCLEIGCGTGKNTEYLLSRAKKVTAVDFSTEMLAKAKQKIKSRKVKFIQADITRYWDFGDQAFDLITFSLVLEHIYDLNELFRKVADVSAPHNLIYIGELHPWKQYSGSKARFGTEKGEQVLICYTHHLTDYIMAARNNGFNIKAIQEYFDNDDRTLPPRILTILLEKMK